MSIPLAPGSWNCARRTHRSARKLDELILHVEKQDHADESKLKDILNERIALVIEMHPNRIVFESAEEMRHLQGVGHQLKEQRLVDHRPKCLRTCHGKPEEPGHERVICAQSSVDGIRTPFLQLGTPISPRWGPMNLEASP